MLAAPLLTGPPFFLAIPGHEKDPDVEPALRGYDSHAIIDRFRFVDQNTPAGPMDAAQHGTEHGTEHFHIIRKQPAA